MHGAKALLVEQKMAVKQSRVFPSLTATEEIAINVHDRPRRSDPKKHLRTSVGAPEEPAL